MIRRVVGLKIGAGRQDLLYIILLKYVLGGSGLSPIDRAVFGDWESRARFGTKQMLWWQQIFALWVLTHMLWAAVRLQTEWKRGRRRDGLALQPDTKIYAGQNVEGVRTHAK